MACSPRPAFPFQFNTKTQKSSKVRQRHRVQLFCANRPLTLEPINRGFFFLFFFSRSKPPFFLPFACFLTTYSLVSVPQKSDAPPFILFSWTLPSTSTLTCKTAHNFLEPAVGHGARQTSVRAFLVVGYRRSCQGTIVLVCWMCCGRDLAS